MSAGRVEIFTSYKSSTWETLFKWKEDMQRDTYSLWFICLISQKSVHCCAPAIYIAVINSTNTESVHCVVRTRSRSVVQLKYLLNGLLNSMVLLYSMHSTAYWLSSSLHYIKYNVFSWASVHSRLWVTTLIYVIIHYVFYICTVQCSRPQLQFCQCNCGLLQAYR